MGTHLILYSKSAIVLCAVRFVLRIFEFGTMGENQAC